MRYERAKRVLLGFLAAYALIGFWAHLTSADQEDAYPFFSWLLFIRAPQHEQEIYDIRVIAVEGKKLETPRSLVDMPDVYDVSNVSYKEIPEAARNIGVAIRSNNQAMLDELLNALDASFKASAVYEVQKQTVDPLEYFLRKTAATSTTIAVFEVRK